MVQSRKSTSERSSPGDQAGSNHPMGSDNFSVSRSASSINSARLRSGYSSQDNPSQRRREMMPSRLAAYNFRNGSSSPRGAPPPRVPKTCGPSGPQTPLPTLFGKGPDYHSFPRVELSTLEALEAASIMTSSSLTFQ